MNIVEHPCLGAMTTMRVGGHARTLIELEKADFEREVKLPVESGEPPFILGGGSNLLVRDGELDLVVIRKACQGFPRVLSEEGGRVRVRVDGGCPLVRLLVWAAKRGLRGLEGLAGVPGTVGGGVAMNAGSHGQDFGQVLERVRFWSPETGVNQAGADRFVTGYRSFTLRSVPGWFLILEADLLLQRDEPGRVMADYRNWFSRKVRVQPLKAHTAGCVFKNPPGGSAGRRLDRAGLRGVRCGRMEFSRQHANFMANTGGGTFEQALELIDLARRTVMERQGINLELEVRIVS